MADAQIPIIDPVNDPQGTRIYGNAPPTEPVVSNPFPEATPEPNVRNNQTVQSAPASAMTADPLSVPDTGVFKHLADSFDAESDAAATLANRDTFMNRTRALYQESDLGKLDHKADVWFDSLFGDQAVPEQDFIPEEHIPDAIAAAGIAQTQDNRDYLLDSVSQEDLADRVLELKNHQANTELLARHPYQAIGSQLVDPVGWAVGAATLGGSRALQLGRMANTVVGAMAGAGYTGVHSSLSIEKSGADEYVLGGLAGGALGALFSYKVPQYAVQGMQDAAAKVQGVANGSSSKITRAFSVYDDLARGENTLKVVDSVLQSGVGGQQEASAAALRRNFAQLSQQEVIRTERAFMDAAGQKNLFGKIRNGLANDKARSQVNAELQQVMNERNKAAQLGIAPPMPTDPKMRELVEAYEAMQAKALSIAKASNLDGFRDIEFTAGYYHRSWDSDTMARMVQTHGREFVHQLIEQGIKNITGNVNPELAMWQARAIVKRVESRANATRSNFSADLGDMDRALLREELEQMGATKATIDHLANLVENSQRDRATIRYAKNRIPMDMTTSMQAPDGSVVHLADFINGNMDALGENYIQQMLGRSALAKASGYGAEGGKPLNSLGTDYLHAAIADGLDKETLKHTQTLLDEAIGDFTGIKPKGADTGEFLKALTAWSSSTSLSNSGIWQIQEYSRIAHIFGLRQALKSSPLLRRMTRRAGVPDTATQIRSVLGLDLASDVRVKPFVSQLEHGISLQNSWFTRTLHLGKQYTPILNGMKFVHGAQAKLVMNLSAHTLYKAAHGDKASLRILAENTHSNQYHKAMEGIKKYAQGDGKNPTDLRLGLWEGDYKDALTDTLMSLGDSALLMGRTGETGAWQYSPTGKIFGMFLQYVNVAHNKVMRRTIKNGGYKGLAIAMAYELPMALLTANLRSVVSGKTPENDSSYWKNTTLQAAMNLSNVGMFGVAAGILGIAGNPTGFSTPLLAPINNAARFGQGASNLLSDPSKGAAQMTNAGVSMIPFVSIIPGVKAFTKVMTNTD